MDAMEKGPQAKTDYNSVSDGDDNDEENEDDDDNQGFYMENQRNGSTIMNTRSIHKLYRNGIGGNVVGSNVSGSGSGASAGSGFRIRIPTGVSIAQPGPKFYPKIDHKYIGTPNLGSNSTPKPNFGVGSGSGSGLGSGRVLRGSDEGGKKREKEPMEEMVAAIKVLGDGFVRMEQMKMEMAREMETMRMEMEMKRTEMILESQQRIVEAFAKAFSEKKKKPKRLPSPES